MDQKINMQEQLAAFGKQIPNVMNALMQLHDEVVKDGVLDAKTKELMMVAIAVAIRCEYCLWSHVPMAAKLGASRQEILEATETAILMSGGPGAAYGSMVVLKILDELKIGDGQMTEEGKLFKCSNCGQEVAEEDGIQEGGQFFCEECYLDKHQKIKACDPWGVHSKKVLREIAGQEGTEGLTDLQMKIYEFIVSRDGATPAEIAQELEISPNELQNQIAILRHCELLKGQDRDGIVYMVPFDALPYDALAIGGGH